MNMSKHLALLVAGLLTVCAAATAIGQTPFGFRLDLVTSRNEMGGKTDRNSFSVVLQPDQKATLRLDESPQPQVSCLMPDGVAKFVETIVEPTIRPEASGLFNVTIGITLRSREGCRTVGGLKIPVFSNRVTTKVVRLRDGEATQFTLGNNVQADLTLTVVKP
jgi:hypothetical protein